jgi:hypothetical protein
MATDIIAPWNTNTVPFCGVLSLCCQSIYLDQSLTGINFNKADTQVSECAPD